MSPLAPGRYKVQFTASAALRDKLERLQGLMRSSVPDGDLAAIIEQAVSEKLERLEALRFARHRHPFGFGGDHSLANIALVCQQHNQRLAETDYGQREMEARRTARRTIGERAPSPSP